MGIRAYFKQLAIFTLVWAVWGVPMGWLLWNFTNVLVSRVVGLATLAAYVGAMYLEGLAF